MTDRATPLAFNTVGVGWHLKPRRRIFLRVAGVLGAAIFVGPGIAAGLQGKYLAAVFLVVVGVCFGLLPMDLPRRRLPARRHDGADGAGLLLPVHPMRLTTIVACAVIGLVLSASGVGMAVEGAQAGDLGQVVGSLVALLIGVLLLLGSRAGIRGRRLVERGLLLTPGAVVTRLGRETVTVPWDEVERVHAHWRRRTRGAFTSVDEQVHNWLSFELREGSTVEPDPLQLLSGSTGPSVDAGDLAVDPYAVLDLARFYLDHPDARGELATDASLARLSQLERARSGR